VSPRGNNGIVVPASLNLIMFSKLLSPAVPGTWWGQSQPGVWLSCCCPASSCPTSDPCEAAPVVPVTEQQGEEQLLFPESGLYTETLLQHGVAACVE